MDLKQILAMTDSEKTILGMILSRNMDIDTGGISVRKFPQVIEDIKEWRDSILGWHVEEPTEQGLYLVTILADVDYPEPTVDLLYYCTTARKHKWQIPIYYAMHPFRGKVLAWMKKPEPYKGVVS